LPTDTHTRLPYANKKTDQSRLTLCPWMCQSSLQLTLTLITHMTRMISTHLPMCIMNICYEPVHDLVRTCTSNHAYTISSLYAHNPHYAQLVEI